MRSIFFICLTTLVWLSCSYPKRICQVSDYGKIVGVAKNGKNGIIVVAYATDTVRQWYPYPSTALIGKTIRGCCNWTTNPKFKY